MQLSPTSDRPSIALASDTPELDEMKRELTHAIAMASEYYDRAEHALNTRYCWWDGQRRDGRKEGTLERPAFPWEGASDTRIRTVDLVITEQTEMLLGALQKMAIQCTPTKAGNADMAARLNVLLRWYMQNAMADEAECELEPLANYMLTYGSAVAGIHWLQTLSYEVVTVKLQDLMEQAKQMGGPQMLADLGRMLFDPAQEATVLQFIQGISSMLTKTEARKVLKDLKQTGSATFPKPFLDQSRPSITALQTFQDIFFPVNTWNLQKARWIAQRELMTETELREKAEGREGWDSEWVENVIESQRGKTFNGNLYALQLLMRQRMLGGVWGEWMNEAEDLYEVWHFYTRASRDGIPAIFHTVMHPNVAELYALHELSDYKHGQMPFVAFTRERTCRSILGSRGLPELLDTQQKEIKVQRDSRVDRASITTLPPIKVKVSPGKLKRVYGPGVEIPVNKMDDLDPLQFGAPDETSIEVENAAKADVNEYAGRMGPGMDPQTIMDRKQALVARWLRGWNIGAKQIIQLAQQYTPPATIPRIVGMTSQPIPIDRESIAGQFDLLLSFDVRFSDKEFVWQLMERLEQYVLPIDTNAVVNRDVLIKYVLSAIDPTLADLAIRDSDAAQTGEIEDEQANVAKMFAGQEPPMKLQGQNFAARLQVLQTAVQNPRVRTLAQQWPDFGEMLQRRADFLQQQVEQQKNKMIGVYGVAPSAGSAGGPQLGLPQGAPGAGN